MINNRLVVSSSPHVRSGETVSSVMFDVVLALCPALIAGAYFFGFRALLVTALTVLSCIAAEYVWQKLSKKAVTVNDWSAVVTGILLAFNLPVTVPLWMPVIGGFFAIIIVKQLFGGLGQNFMNPALAARAFLLASWPVAMTKWVGPFEQLSLAGAVDVVSSATPLAILKGTEAAGQVMPSYLDLFMGRIGGSIGETSVLMLLLGGVYLIYRKVISWRIPVSFIATVAVLTFVLGKDGFFTGNAIYHVLSGGLMLGAFFMATDYASSPVTPKGQIIMGIGCGLITSVIRLYGGYPEGVSYSILLMNIVTPLIDRYTAPVKFGEVKARA
ncbi:RnfABCDGE type electron transport complex subunit D [Petroclostridium sp. X23]|uniref:RnfABCDGE type electron transport complex subunit D n=1 Tax=Petroclostridium sp. X23 TaxID=3045146 RepID=UPI0024AE820A|nr:RnfABCDGE type electron transport complex subunit D [Petroclostridium sp. X23]WHH61043.1 RnfABCDGE type electron transport complex subunit D [Petroclostridium sp. X23]